MLPRTGCRSADACANSPAPLVRSSKPVVLLLSVVLVPFLLLLLQPLFAFLTACPSPFSPPRLLDFSLLSCFSSVPSFTRFPEQETKLDGVGTGYMNF